MRQGDILGIIGRNGAGKSTLLKILSQVTAPTEGVVKIKGRVASLLEVGTGFHPELTGRENAYLNGAILGMTRAEVTRKLDEIIAFAEVDRFIDTPVKRYSSGMYVRLAFAVAAHLEPEILIVDEVLAVGDAAFQRKCIGKMGSVAHGGRTVLFVSHNMAAVSTLCTRAILLENGRVTAEGDVASVVSEYLQHSAEGAALDRVWHDNETAPGRAGVRLHRIRLVTGGNGTPQPITVETPLSVEATFRNGEDGVRVFPALCLMGSDASPVFESAPTGDAALAGQPLPKGTFRVRCEIPGSLLNEGHYTVWFALVDDAAREVCEVRDALSFRVDDTQQRAMGWLGKSVGPVRPRLAWSIERVSDMG